jgi:hypothetical protein
MSAERAARTVRRKPKAILLGNFAALAISVGVLAPCQASALPCALTDADYQSLANATETPFSKEDIEALDPNDQEALCKARKFYNEARGKDPRAVARTHTLQDIPRKISRFLTPEEYGEIRSAMSEVLVEDTIKKKKSPRDRK